MKSTLGTLSLIVLLLLTACQDSKEEGNGSTRADGAEQSTSDAPVPEVDKVPRTEPQRLWQRKLGQSFYQPEVIDDTAIVVVSARGDELDIAGLDVRTGKTRWSHPYYPAGGGSPDIGSLVYESEDGRPYVLFQRAATGSALAAGARTPYLAADPATGKILGRSRPVVAAFPAITCPDADACLTIGAGYAKQRWRPGSRAIEPARFGTPGRNAYPLRDGDFYTGYDLDAVVGELRTSVVPGGVVGRGGSTSRTSWTRGSGPPPMSRRTSTTPSSSWASFRPGRTSHAAGARPRRDLHRRPLAAADGGP